MSDELQRTNDIDVSVSGGLRNLPDAIDAAAAIGTPILPKDVAWADEEMDDETALGIVLADANAAIGYLQSKALMPIGVDIADDLVRAYVKPRLWSNGKPRASMPMFVVLEAIEKVLPALYMSLFGAGKRHPFAIVPIGKTTPEAARAKGSILYWAIKNAGLKEEMRRTLKTCLTYGFVIGWWGWDHKEVQKRVYTKGRNNKIKRDWKSIEINCPTYSCPNLKNIIFDPNCDRQDVQVGARFIGKQIMITANDLDDWREDLDTYGRDELDGEGNPTGKRVSRIPSREVLATVLANKEEPTEDTMASNKHAVWREFQAQIDDEASSKDPLNQPLEYFEYWDRGHVFGVLQRKLVLRNQRNEWHELPGVSCAFIDVLGSAWGFGIARLIAGEQRLQTGVANNWLDSLALVLNPVYQLLKGIGPGTQNIPVSPGKVITESGELKPLITPDVTGPAMTAIASSEERASKRVASNSGSDLPHQALRTGTGVNALTQDVVQRLQYFLEIFINNIYLPVLDKFLMLCMEKLEPEQLNHILTEEEGKAWEGDILDVYNAQVDVDVIAGANLMAKIASAQLMPSVIQLVSSAPVLDSFQIQNKKFNFMNYISTTLELQGLDIDNIIEEMTPADQQRAAAMNAARAKGVADQQLQQQKHADDMELVNEKGTVQAGVAVVKKTAEAQIQSGQNEIGALSNQGGGQ